LKIAAAAVLYCSFAGQKSASLLLSLLLLLLLLLILTLA